MKKIPVYLHGSIADYATVDDEDYERLSAYSWYLNPDGYAVRHEHPDGKTRTIRMHREVLGLKHGDKRHCDHLDRNPLNNTKANLRKCTNAENRRNQGRRKDNTSGYRGVYWQKRDKKWRARARVLGRPLVHLGFYHDKLAASYAVELFISLVTPYEDFENQQWPPVDQIQQDELTKAKEYAHKAAQKFKEQLNAQPQEPTPTDHPVSI